MSAFLHSLTGIGLTTTSEFGSDHNPLLLLRVVAHFISVPLISDVELMGLEVLNVNIIELCLFQRLEGEDNVLGFVHPPGANALVKAQKLSRHCLLRMGL